MNTKKFTLTAMFAALTCVATMVIHIPSPMNGYVNLGDAIVLLGAFLLGPVPGMIAAGLGSMLADLFLGYSSYMFASLIIKGLMGLCAGLIVKKYSSVISSSIAAVASEAIMVCGYFLFEALLLGNGLAALSGVPGNLVQGGAGIIVSVILYAVLKKNKYIMSLAK